MNGYELVGQTVVFLGVSFVGLYVTFYILRYLAIAWALIYTHCISGAGTKKEYKQKRFWRIRLAFKLFFSFRYITGFFGTTSISCPFYNIDFEYFIPKVTLYKDEV